MTALAPSSRALSIMRSIAWRRLSSSKAVYWGTSPWRSAVSPAPKDFAMPMLRTTRPNVSPRSRSTVMPSSPRAVVTGKVAGEDSDMTIILGNDRRPPMHGQAKPLRFLCGSACRAQVAVHQGDGGRAFANRGSDPLDRSAAHVTGCEHPGQAGLQRQWRAAGAPVVAAAAQYVPAGADEPPPVACDGLAEPFRPRLRAD